MSHTNQTENSIITRLQETNFFSYAIVVYVTERADGLDRAYIKGFVCMNRQVFNVRDRLGDVHVTALNNGNGKSAIIEDEYVKMANRANCALLLRKETIQETTKLYLSTNRLTFTLAGCCDAQSVHLYLTEIGNRCELVIAVKNGTTIMGFIHFKQQSVCLSTIYNKLRNWDYGITVERIDHVDKTTSDASIIRAYKDIVSQGGELFFTNKHDDEQHDEKSQVSGATAQV